MFPFQVWNEEHQRFDFHFDKWKEYSNALQRQYPVGDKPRVELELIFPSQRLEDVYVHDWNPHHAIGNYHLSVYDCFYDSSDWSTIFDVYPGCNSASCRIFAEKGHDNPWGESVRLMSTASDIYNTSSHRYAYLRGQYWKVLSFIRHDVPVVDWDELTQYILPPADRGVSFMYYNDWYAPYYFDIDRFLDLVRIHDYDPPSSNWKQEGF